MRRWSLLVALPLMVAFGFGVYFGLGHLKTRPAQQVKPVTKSRTLIDLPGVVYVSQGGVLYRLVNGGFTAIRPGPGAWVQPAAAPNGQLVAVSRQNFFSDLYLLDASGQPVRQLTKNESGSVESNHWAFYPSLSPDGKTLFYSYDPKDPQNSFRVDLAIWSMPLDGSQSAGKRRTVPNEYTGGDIQPVPLASGALLYTKYGIDDAGHSTAQLWLQPRAGAIGQALTDARDGCSSPALSRDGSHLAMVCTGGKQTSSIEVAPFDGQKLGPRQVVVEGQLAAAPTWSPDGRSLLYVAPGGSQGQFQLWVIQLEWAAPTPSPTADKSGHPVANVSPAPTVSKPKLVTTDLDLDATSEPVWTTAA
jgi:Tol biopolymer transport system component